MKTSAIALPENKIQRIVWTLLFLFPIFGMCVDLVAPSLPAISSSLHVSASTAKNVISLYLLGYAFGNFFTGFLADSWGRQKMLRVGLFGFVIASLIPVFSHSIDLLFLSRVLQGITIGAVSVLARAMFSDVLPTEKLTSLGTVIGTMWGLGPILGPVIGGYLQFYFNWQAGFVFFALISLIALIAVWIVIPETHFNRHPLKINTIKKNSREVVSHRLFMALVILMGFAYSLLIAFNTAGPFLIQSVLHHSPVFFGHVALCIGVVFLASTLTCRHLLKKHKAENLLFYAIIISFFIAALSVALSFLFEQSTLFVVIFSALMFFSCGFIFPMSMGRGLSLFRHIAGTATAYMYLIQILMTGFFSFLVSLVHVKDNTDMMVIYFLLLFSSVVVYALMIYNKKR
jgi:MFS transporter, DHA1 family, multidrug resistance protein